MPPQRSDKVSNKRRRQLELADLIERFQRPAYESCKYCAKHGNMCFIMPKKEMQTRGGKGGEKCSSCTRLGRANCDAVSWERMDKTREKLQSNLCTAQEAAAKASADAAEAYKRITEVSAVATQESARVVREQKALDNFMDKYERRLFHEIAGLMEELEEDAEGFALPDPLPRVENFSVAEDLISTLDPAWTFNVGLEGLFGGTSV